MSTSTFTYEAPFSSEIAQVRRAIGDVAVQRPIFWDDEIQGFLDSAGSVSGAIRQALQALATRLATRDVKAANSLAALADRIRVDAARQSAAAPFLSTSPEDPNLQPEFVRGQFKSP